MASLLKTSARVLEFDALRELLRGYAASPLGQARIDALAPTTDAAWIEEQQDLTEEVREFRRVGGRFDFTGLMDVEEWLHESRIAGAALETTEIRDVLLVVGRAAEWREIALHPPANMRTEWKRVREMSGKIPDFSDLLRLFRNKIQPDGTLEDSALRRRIGAGRTHHHPRRAFCDSGQGRAEAAGAGRGARGQFQRANGFCGAARNH
jgi:DNA mismatch repair protein MutS2